MYRCETWTIKKAEHGRINAFEMWWRLLRVPWTSRRSNQSILKEISPDYSLEELMLKLKLQYFGHLMWRANSLKKTLMLGKIEGRRRREHQRVFPVVMYGCESWTIKKAEHSRIDAFELCWRRLLRVLWTARRSNQSILKEISPDYSLEELMLKLKLHYFGYLIWRTDSFDNLDVHQQMNG